MRICRNAIYWLQISDHEGSVRSCPWMRDPVVGKLSESNLIDIWHGEKIEIIRQRLAKGDYSCCRIDACPFLSMGTIEKNLVEIERIPEYPPEIYLAFERNCNYRCTSCKTPEYVPDCDPKIKEQGYINIYNKISPILPYVRTISANGLGELFVSKYALKILSEWKPKAPKEKLHVVLETNGSLFNEANWKKIENLGQYDLHVAITIMSFDEHLYQILSGTRLPITQIESNLKFVKKLREQGIINHLQLATVVQERNFRLLPEFTKRCIEEFGADSVRLRPFDFQGAAPPEVEWFTDVRCKYHPYNAEYKEIMQHPIFKHPKVHDWSGGRDSQRQELPQIIQLREANKRCNQYREKVKILEMMLEETDWMQSMNEIVKDKNIVIYGIGVIGRKIIEAVIDKKRIRCILDKFVDDTSFANIEILRPNDVVPEIKTLDVIVTPVFNTGRIEADLREMGYTGNFIDVREIMGLKSRECI